jgi:hypothetical protein
MDDGARKQNYPQRPGAERGLTAPRGLGFTTP